MLAKETKDILCEVLIAISDAERQIEIVRQILAEQEDFEPYAAFKRIDRHKRGYIDLYDVRGILLDYGIHYPDKVINAFIRKYDTYKNGHLTYNQFLIVVLPMDNPLLRTTATLRPNYEVGQDEYLQYDVEYALVKVMDKEMSLFANLDQQKIQLINRYDYNHADAFKAIDRDNTGYIDYDSLKGFFKAQSIEIHDEEIIAILRRIDKDDDGLLTYDEFKEFFEPIDSSTKYNSRINTSRGSSPLTRTPIKRDIRLNIITNGRSSILKGRSPINSAELNGVSPVKKFLDSEAQLASLKIHRNTGNSLYSTSTKANNTRTTSIGRTSSVLKTRDDKDQNDRKTLGGTNRSGHTPKDSFDNKASSQANNKSATKSNRVSIVTPDENSYTKPSPSRSICRRINKNIDYDSDEYNDTNTVLIKTFLQFINLDKDLELAKQDLALRPDFNLLDLFRIFDTTGHGSISTIELENGIKKFNVYCCKDDLYLFCKRMNKDKDGKLKFANFVQIFSPKQIEYTTLLNNRLPLNDHNCSNSREIMRMLSSETKRLITKVLNLHLENEATTENLRQKLNKRMQFNLHDAFKFLDINQDGYLTTDEFKSILETQEAYTTEKELKLLFDRFDLNQDGKISYSEFVQELTPKQD